MVRGYLQNKDLIGDTWSPTASIGTLKYLLVDYVKHKSRVRQLGGFGSLLQDKVNKWIFVKLYSRYADNFPEYSIYFGRLLRLLKSMYGITNSGNLFSDEFKILLIN